MAELSQMLNVFTMRLRTSCHSALVEGNLIMKELAKENTKFVIT